jgi:hypothetical protein
MENDPIPYSQRRSEDANRNFHFGFRRPGIQHFNLIASAVFTKKLCLEPLEFTTSSHPLNEIRDGGTNLVGTVFL